MKNIIVSAGVCRQSAAKTIYMQMVEHMKDWVGDNRYILFVDETMPQPEIKGVEYIIVDVRNSRRRMEFDYISCRKILNEKGIEPDLVISLQNTGVACLKNVWQVIYYHQPLPFYPQNWNPLKRDERFLAFYKYAYPLFVSNSIKRGKVDFVAQIPFIKDGIERLYGIEKEYVHVLFPDTEHVERDKLEPYSFEEGTFNFIYPATNVKYKNHMQLVKAVAALKNKDEKTGRLVRIHLTLKELENPDLVLEAKKLDVRNNIVFHGSIPHEELLRMLNSSHGLLFPSTIETLGLPLLEAAKLGKAIVAADLLYAHQVVRAYKGVRYALANDVEAWAGKILELCTEKLLKYEEMLQPENSSWDEFFRLVETRLGGAILKLRDESIGICTKTLVLRTASERRATA